MNINQGSSDPGSFNIATDLDKLPAFVVAHRGVGEALETLDALVHADQKLMHAGEPDIGHTSTFNTQEEAIELLPHLRTDLIADLARVITGRADAGYNRISIGGIEGQRPGNAIIIVGLLLLLVCE